MTAKITATDNNDGTFTFVATPQGGTGPFTYEWTTEGNAVNADISGNTLTMQIGGSPFNPDGSFFAGASVTITDSGTPNPCVATAASGVKRPPTAGCPAGERWNGAECVPLDMPCEAGYHDDGTGTCVLDTRPEPCAAGYELRGGACVPVEPPNPGTCTIDCSFKGTDKGANLYRIEAIPTGVQNPPVTATWKRDGAVLPDVTLFIEATIERNAESVFQCTLTDGDCQIVRSHVQRNEDGGITVEPPIPENATPAKPDAPSATNLHSAESGAVVTISFATWPANSRLVRLFKDGVKVRDWDVTQMPRSVQIEGLADYLTYQFTLQGINGAIAGALSDATPVSVVSPTLEASMSAPIDSDVVTRKTALIALAKLKVGATGPLVVVAYAMRVGGALSATVTDRGIVAANTRRYTDTLDPAGLDFLGAMPLSFEVTDALGLKARALISVNVSFSLAKATRYEHLQITDPSARNLSKAALTTLLDEGDGWVDALVTSPGAGAVLPYDDFAAMETILRDWQSVALDDVFSPLSVAPSPSMEVVLRFTPATLETRYPLGATGALRTRQISDEKIEVLTFEPFKVLEVTPDGVTPILDIAARGFENVIDARRWREDKVVVVTTTEVWVCELDESAADWRVTLRGENRPCVGVETLAAKFILAFADDTGSRVWAHDGTDPVKIYDGAAQVTLMRASGETLAWVTADNEIWSGNPVAVAKIYAHNAPVVDVLFDQTGAVAAFADAMRVYKLSDNGTTRTAALAGQLPASVRSLGFYRGHNALARIVAGASSSAAIYSVAPSSAWGGIWSLGHGASGIDGVGRFLVTHVAVEGDPLMGGKPAITTETLVGVARVPGGGGYVAFIEAAKQTVDNSTRAAGVERLVAVWENA